MAENSTTLGNTIQTPGVARPELYEWIPCRCPPRLTTVSNHIHPRLDTKLTSTPTPPSVLILDHITPEFASTIYQLNFAPPPASEPQESE